MSLAPDAGRGRKGRGQKAGSIARNPADEWLDRVTPQSLHLADRQPLAERGQCAPGSAVVRNGFLFRTRESDGRRAIVSIQTPGDFISLQSYVHKPLDHSIIAVGDVHLSLIAHDALDTVIRQDIGAMRSMWQATLREAALQRAWIQMLDLLDAPRRIAHIYCELQVRLELAGECVRHALRAPFTQLDLGDMCGISTVHANRAIRRLREIELAEIRRGTLYTDDWSELQRYARFEPDYLSV